MKSHSVSLDLTTHIPLCVQGLKKTAKSNFGGGNTDWEEKNLGTYAFSETRLIEITENICKDSDKDVS